MKRIWSLGATVAVGLSAACGSSDDPEGGSQRGIAIDDLPAHYAAAACSAARSCWGAVFAVVTGGEDCEDNTETAIAEELGRLKQSIAAGTVKYDATRAAACFDAVVARGCNQTGEPAACTEMLDGTVAIGGACSTSFDCQGNDSYCKSTGTCPGSCAPRESAEGPCSTNDDCQAGLRCDAKLERCFAPAGAGDRCGGGTEPECGDGLFCLGEDKKQQRPGNCRTIAEAFSGSAGERCLLDAPLCKADLRCVIEGVDVATGGITTKCGASVASGAACKLAFPDQCPDGEYCAVPPSALDGTCKKKPGSGAPCAARGDDPADICAAGTRCDGGQCRSRQKLGGSCSGDAVCYSAHCVNGGCASANTCE